LSGCLFKKKFKVDIIEKMNMNVVAEKVVVFRDIIAAAAQ
jgi:hypothetical protein